MALRGKKIEYGRVFSDLNSAKGYSHNEERNNEIKQELQNIEDFFQEKLSNTFSKAIDNFYLNHPSYEVGTISKVIQFIKFILDCYGYNEEEVLEFFKKNRNMIIVNYSDFRARLAIFNHIGLFEEVFFSRYSLLTSLLELCYGVKTSALYSIIFSSKINSYQDLIDVLERIKFSRLEELRHNTPFDSEHLKELDKEMMQMLKVKMSINKFKRQREVKSDEE